MKTHGMDKFSQRLDEIFEQGNPTKAQILDAYNKATSLPSLTKERIIEVLNNHKHTMAGHDWLIGVSECDFGSIASALCSEPESSHFCTCGDQQDLEDILGSGKPVTKCNHCGQSVEPDKTIAPHIILMEWEKANNPFYPNPMKWNRNDLHKLIEFANQFKTK
jgi:hypothetical protein